jgi:hypothetical protein
LTRRPTDEVSPARYFFHMRDGEQELRDPHGAVLPHVAAAKTIAVVAICDFLQRDPNRLRDSSPLETEVVDARGWVVVKAQLVAGESPA